MTAETTEKRRDTDAIPAQPHRSPARKNKIIRELALAKHNDQTHRDIALKNGVTKQYVSRVSMDNREEIEELQGLAAEKLLELWIMDPFNRALERMTDIEELNEELAHHKAQAAGFAASRGTPGEPVGDQYYKAMETKHKIMRQIEESAGQLPTRAAPIPPEQGKATYEMPGVDLGEVIQQWAQAQIAPVEVPK